MGKRLKKLTVHIRSEAACQERTWGKDLGRGRKLGVRKKLSVARKLWAWTRAGGERPVVRMGLRSEWSAGRET
jgi:hypothetical protein